MVVEKVTAARGTGDGDQTGDPVSLGTLLADVFKLLNSAYEKFIEARERQTDVFYTKDEKVLDEIAQACACWSSIVFTCI